MTDEEREDLRCDVLLLIAIPSEEQKLKEAATKLGLDFDRKSIPNLGKYFRIGMVGSNKVNAVRTEMGPFSHGGSASIAMNYRTATGATAIIQLGMAFGVDPKLQNHGDVLVSTSLYPYDLREVRSKGSESMVMPDDVELADEIEGSASQNVATNGDQSNKEYFTDYKWAIPHPANEALVRMFKNERDRGKCEYGVHIGGMLSGGARIFSRSFLRELVTGVPQEGEGIVGGEMEGVGLLSLSPRNNPLWIVVKAISDFADEDRDSVIKTTRPVACRNSANFVLSALANSTPA